MLWHGVVVLLCTGTRYSVAACVVVLWPQSFCTSLGWRISADGRCAGHRGVERTVWCEEHTERTFNMRVESKSTGVIYRYVRCIGYESTLDWGAFVLPAESKTWRGGSTVLAPSDLQDMSAMSTCDDACIWHKKTRNCCTPDVIGTTGGAMWAAPCVGGCGVSCLGSLPSERDTLWYCTTDMEFAVSSTAVSPTDWVIYVQFASRFILGYQ